MALKVKKQVSVDFYGHNGKYYAHYRTHALNILKKDLSPKNIDKVKKTLLETYSDLDPYDTPYDIKGISAEEKDLFVKNKKSINQKIHNLIIEEVFKDIEEDNPNFVLTHKKIKMPIDFSEIQSQTKYMSHVIEELQNKIKRRTTKEINKLAGELSDPEERGIVTDLANRIETQLEDHFSGTLEKLIDTNPFSVDNSNLKGVSFISKTQNTPNVKNIVEKIVNETLLASKGNEKLNKKLQNTLERITNYVRNNIVRNRVEHVLDASARELELFNNNLQNIDSTELVGLGNYADKLTVFSEVLDNRNVDISTNFFNMNSGLFKNSADFLYGWIMEILSTIILILNDKSYQNMDITAIKPEDWERIGHFHGAIKVYLQEKDSGLYFQEKNYKKTQGETITVNGKEYKKEEVFALFREVKDILKTVEKNFNIKIIEKYIKGTSNLKNEIEEVLFGLDEVLHQHPLFQKAPELFAQNNNIEKANVKNHTRSLMEKISQLNKTHKFNTLNPGTVFKTQEMMLKTYNKSRHMPMLDTIVHKDGVIEEIHEVKTMSKSNGYVRIPWQVPASMKDDRNQKDLKEVFHIENGEYDFRFDNLEAMKNIQGTIFEKQTSKENGVESIGLDTGKLFYIFNIIDERNGISTLYKIPLEAYHELFRRDDLFSNVKLGKRYGYKFFCDIESDFFEEVFKEYKVSPTEHIKPMNRCRNPRY